MSAAEWVLILFTTTGFSTATITSTVVPMQNRAACETAVTSSAAKSGLSAGWLCISTTTGEVFGASPKKVGGVQ